MRNITIKRDQASASITLINQGGVEIGRLYDDEQSIRFDKFADSLDVLGMYDDKLSWAEWLDKNGLTVDEIRMIDAMPAPDVNL